MTFLFTDIDGSTRRWEKDADLMRKALAAHDEVLRSTVEFKHTGDGVCAAFRFDLGYLRLAPDETGDRWTQVTRRRI